MGIMVQWSRN